MPNKEVTQLIRQLEAHGWTFERSRRGGHWKGRGPNGERATLPYSPSDARTMRNVRAQLRRIGAPLPARS